MPRCMLGAVVLASTRLALPGSNPLSGANRRVHFPTSNPLEKETPRCFPSCQAAQVPGHQPRALPKAAAMVLGLP